MRSALRSLSVSVVGLVLAGVLFVAPASAVRVGAAQKPSGSLLGGPLVAPSTDQLLLGEGARAARQARRSSPQAVAQRSAARSQFEGLSLARAADEAQSAYPALIEQPAAGVPVLPRGQRIVRYATNHAAEVSLPGGAKGVLESFAPIATTSGHRHVPLDLRLTEAGGGFAPVRSDVDIEVPRRISEGVSLTDLGVSLTTVDSTGAPLAGSEGALEGASVIWRHSDRDPRARDLASVAKASSSGFDLTTMLLSQRSPGKLYFRVGVPAGARLAEARGGSVQIRRGRKLLATISPISAEDAEGTSVPVAMSVHGREIELTLDLAGDYLYPIAVDPEVNDSQLAETTAHKRSNWEFHTSNAGRFGGAMVYEGPGAERLESKGLSSYAGGEWAYWGYQTKGVSHIYEIKTETSGHNKGAKIESALEFFNPSAALETRKVLSTESANTEYERKAVTACAANGAGSEECLPGSGKPNNAVHFQQAATASPSNPFFSDTMYQGIVSIAEPNGTHSTTGYNTTSPTIELEVENELKEKVKVSRTNALYGSGAWLSKLSGPAGGALELKAADPGIGVSATKLEYESSPGVWTPLEEHNYLAQNGCQGVQCYTTHNETWTLSSLLPDGEQKVRYRAEEAMAGTQSLESEGQATVKVDSKKPHNLEIEGLPYGNELSERPYKLEVEATDGEGTTVASSGIKSISLFVDGHEVGLPAGSCTAAKGACTATTTRTVNGAELGAGKHDIEIVAFDNAGNEARAYEPITIRHSTPVAFGPGSVDLQSGDFALGATDASLGSGLTVGRNHSSRNLTQGYSGPLGPEWNLSLGTAESLEEMVDGSILLTAANGKQTIFGALGSGKFESPTGDSNLELTLEEEKTTKKPIAYYLKNASNGTSVKFTQQAGSPSWLPTKQEGLVPTDTLTYKYTTLTSFTEYKRSWEGEPHQPQRMIAAPDGHLWFTGFTSVARVSTTGAIAEFALPSKAEADDLTVGPEGNVWCAAGGKVAKITPSGGITEFSVPGYDSVRGIATGPDGNLWLTDPANAIYKMTPTGTFTKYSVPVGKYPQRITAGPDGNLWFTEGANSSSAIGRITPSGAIAEYPTSTLGAYAITTGPDGNLWFTENQGKKIGKITTGGAITEYSVPKETEPEPMDIAVGPDKNLWVGTRGFASIYKVTTSGSITQASGGWATQTVAAGPDGKLWFPTERGIRTMTPSGNIVVPEEVQAPVPAGVSCAPEMKPGCRSLYFQYDTGANEAKGDAESEWGRYAGRLEAVYLRAYNNATAKMEYTKVAQYTYDARGRLRAEWDPRVSPALKTTYGYDNEGHITAIDPPGQEPWTLTYGAIAGDTGTGRLLKLARVPASAALWNGEVVSRSEAPAISGSATEGATLSASKGKWLGSPVTFGYQWQRCAGAEGCTAIPGATNPTYKVGAADVGDTLRVVVEATNGDGSVAASSAETASGQASASLVTEYSLPATSNPKGIAPGPASGTLWFTDRGTNKISMTTSSGAVTEYALPAGSGPEGIVQGPDGNLWFTESTGNKVGKITTTGTISEYAVPAGSGPWGIAAGPDGNLWFTNNISNKIGKITTTGTITEYAQPTKGLSGIVAGPDGNLWFTASTSNKIGKITTSGAVTEYSLPAGASPTGIVSGPDGNLWYIDVGTHKIGKITTSGTISEYALPIGPEALTSASGYLWATGRNSNELVRVATSGTSAQFVLPAEAKPERIAANSLGELWYTAAGDKLAKIASGNLGDGEAKPPEPGVTLNYQVPISGTGAPYNMSEAKVAKWAQTDLPVEATAITAPDEPQGWPASGYKRATVHYLDNQGRQVNTASPNGQIWGAISTTEYNEYNDVIRTLTPENRVMAMLAGEHSAEESKMLDTQSTFNGEGAKEHEVAEPGTMLIETLGPQHEIKYHAGGEVKESLARDHTKFVYNQGAPSGGETYHLLTEQYDLAQLANHEEVEVRITKKAYSGQGNLGWKLRTPTSVTVDPEGLNLTTTTEYNAATGQITEVRGAAAEKTLSYATKFGGLGTGSGKLKNPWGAAVSSEGNVWVVDAGNSRVEEFNSAGTYVASSGTAGSGNGQFKEPEGIALDAAGHIWVADTGNNRIEEFSSTGTFMTTVGSLGTESGKLKAPAALAFDPKGNLWVADTGNSRIEKFKSATWAYVSEFGSAGSEPGKLAEPKGIAIDSGEHVWVADTGNNRIQEFSSTGSLLKRFGTPGAGEGQLNGPIDLKIDSLGNIWTVDSLNNRAESFTPKGVYVTQIGWEGGEVGRLNVPRSIVFDATGKAWVVDSGNARVEQWSKGPNAHDQKTIYYSTAANGEYPTCGSHPEWSGLICETLPAKQPELMGLPKLPVTTTTYNMFNEPETITETFGSTTRTKKEGYDAAGRKASSEVTASTGVSLPKVNFTYNSEQGILEKQTTEGEGKVLSGEFNRLGQLVKYTDSDGNVARYKYAGPEGDLLPEEFSDSSASGTSKQTYEYDPTTKRRTKVIDSAAGSFAASYDYEGNLLSVAYPYMCASYAYDSVGEATSVSYRNNSSCTAGTTYYSDSRVPSIRGEIMSQTSTLAEENYAYDVLGRLTESQETPAGAGCTVRAYAYDEEGNRGSSISRTPGVGGACQTEGGTVEAHNYDEADRLADGGMAYDGLGNITKLPAADAEGKELTSTFYVDNAVATQSQGGVSNEYKLDPEGRVRETVSGTKKTKTHYDGPGEAVAWTENAEQWVRNIPGIDGSLLATQTNGATPVLQLHDLQGNVIATIGDKSGETKLLSTYNSTEFGVPNGGKAPPKFAFLGAAGIESSFSTGVITYGSTSYVPQTGRALQSEQIEAPGLGGGSGLGTPYVMQEEPWNMQGAASSAAEAPGREAAREQEAFNSAFKDPWVQSFYNLKEAEDKAEEFFEAESTAVVLSMFDLPEKFIEVLGKFAGEEVSQFSDAYKWLYDAGEKLRKCAGNKRDLHHCRFEYDQNEYTPSVPLPAGLGSISLPVTFSWPNWSVEPVVYECKFFSTGGHECPDEVHIKTEL